MRFWNFDWDEDNIDHIARHGVEVDEVEQALARKPLIRRGRSDRYLAFGRTQEGRYLFIVVKNLGKSWARVITARDMTNSERRYCRRKGK
jgi:uncharacterized DUF497 family protein